MRKVFSLFFVVLLVTSLFIYGCGAKKEESGKAAINVSKTMETTQEKVNYLVGQAKAFYNSKDFQDAVDVAQYILRYLDRDSAQAKKLLEDAKEALANQAKSAMDQAKKKLPFGN